MVNRIAPYVMVGAGFNYAVAKDKHYTNIRRFTMADYKYTNATLPAFGVGATLFTDLGFDIDLGFQYEGTQTDGLDGLEKAGDNDALWFGYVGLSTQFGVKKDRDGDGIADKLDKAPDDPEDYDGFEDSDGVPDPDNDQDGIVDKLDQAPGTDETVKNGINTKETYNGYKDDDGVPDEVPAVKPAPKPEPKPEPKVEPKPEPKVEPKPEPKVEPKPEPKPEPKIEFKKEVNLVLKGVNFKTGSSELTSDAGMVLDEVVASLKENPQVKLEIGGHTDNVGSAVSNQSLSQKRANAVMNYLISKGIDAGRLSAKGYGMTQPISDNNTPDGRAKNRRIEFKVVD